MLSFLVFIAIGASLGAMLRFPRFALAFCALLIGYAVFDLTRAGSAPLPDVILAAVALQIGYFFYILLALALHRGFRKRA